MNKLTSIFVEGSVSHSPLNKKEGYKLYSTWLDLFAHDLKDSNGKYAIGNYIWESYYSGRLPSINGSKALELYRSKAIEDYYIICENGEQAYDCKSANWPNIYGEEAILFPKSKSWSLVFSHEETVHYVVP